MNPGTRVSRSPDLTLHRPASGATLVALRPAARAYPAVVLRGPRASGRDGVRSVANVDITTSGGAKAMSAHHPQPPLLGDGLAMLADRVDEK
jgi:hypothetical protein